MVKCTPLQQVPTPRGWPGSRTARPSVVNRLSRQHHGACVETTVPARVSRFVPVPLTAASEASALLSVGLRTTASTSRL
jgi:hypothetical protein